MLFKEYPDVVDVRQLCQMLGGIGVKTAYRLLKSGKIKSLCIGKGYKIPKIFVLEYLASTSGKSYA
ncbi:MAG: helix-turn-helix domain-containing protein [Clostridia bacterium]|nr:helix-turn-helix domain-containing protein [Clostridia bacterium]